MPSYSAQISADGWFDFVAADDDDAANVAAELTKHGVPIGAEFTWCEVEAIEREGDDDS